MTGEAFTITKSYKIFQGEPKGEPMDESTENQLFGWLRARGYSEDEASKLIEDIDANGHVSIHISKLDSN
ncbi:MAG: hypothetical protein WA637_07945 [Terriglobales bacterium]